MGDEGAGGGGEGVGVWRRARGKGEEGEGRKIGQKKEGGKKRKICARRFKKGGRRQGAGGGEAYPPVHPLIICTASVRTEAESKKARYIYISLSKILAVCLLSNNDITEFTESTLYYQHKRLSIHA